MRSLFLLGFLAVAAADNWAVLVAGSNGYYNYRHQADVCHAYQVLRTNGFTDDRIITMFYDDIARNPQNPVKDNLINEPNGPNVYTGCKKDYTGATVTPENFLKVLSGQPTNVGSKKVVESGPNDRIFVFFSDHGATGILAFPTTELHAVDLNNTIAYMYKNARYKEMLIYIEACEAGSMFNDILNPNINVLAVTASDPTHSSYAIYYDDSRQTYLGDVFSVYWMQDSEKESLTETVQNQIDVVTKLTTTSQVCYYGADSLITPEALSLFQAPAKRLLPRQSALPTGEVMDSRDIQIAVLRHQLDAASHADRPRIADLLSAALHKRQVHDQRIMHLAKSATALVGGRVDFMPSLGRLDEEADLCHTNFVKDPVCLKEMVETMKHACGPFDDYSLKSIRTLNAMCSAGLSAAQMTAAMEEACA